MIPFIGLGTGHCGTRSLHHIINRCAEVDAAHQRFWPTSGQDLVVRFGKEAGSAEHLALYGDVSFYWVTRAAKLKARCPNLKVIVLERDRDDTIDAFLRRNRGDTIHGELGFLAEDNWPPTFPPIPMAEEAERVGLYIDWYYDQARLIPDALWVDTYDLNDDKVIHNIFDFLEIPEKHRRLSTKRQWGHNC